MSEEKILRELDKAVVSARGDLSNALADEDWVAAIDATLGGLLYRATALAIRHGVPSTTLDFRVDGRMRALVLKHYILANASALNATSPDPNGAREVVVETIDAVVAALNDLEHGIRSPDGYARLMMMGGRLGWADTLLGFSEEGHWDQIESWRRRQGGRPGGYTAPWRETIAPEIQKWINAEPTMRKSALADRVADWLIENPIANIQADSIPKALRAMEEAGLYRWPPKTKST